MEGTAYQPSLSPLPPSFWKSCLYLLSLFNPLKSTFCPLHSSGSTSAKLIDDLSLKKPYDTVQPILHCPFCSIWQDDHSFFLIILSPRSHYSLLVLFFPQGLLLWAPLPRLVLSCQCSALSLLSITPHTLSPRDLICFHGFKCHSCGDSFEIFISSPDLLPELQIWPSK